MNALCNSWYGAVPPPAFSWLVTLFVVSGMDGSPGIWVDARHYKLLVCERFISAQSRGTFCWILQHESLHTLIATWSFTAFFSVDGSGAACVQ